MENINIDFIREIQNACGCTKTAIVHSDVMKAMHAVKIVSNKDLLLARHLQAIKYVVQDCDIFFPTFNYSFPRTRIFNLSDDESEVGVLSEYARTSWSEWRTEDPIFSFCGIGKKPKNCELKYELTDPFSESSVFAHVVNTDGIVIMYGANLSALTLIHYIERLSGGPLYRYDKIFSGHIVDLQQEKKEVNLLYHVRPLGQNLDYDWDKIEADFLKNNLIKIFPKGSSRIMLLEAKNICLFLLEMLKSDPLYLLDNRSKSWVSKKLDEVGRRFTIKDFEI